LDISDKIYYAETKHWEGMNLGREPEKGVKHDFKEHRLQWKPGQRRLGVGIKGYLWDLLRFKCLLDI
jgi:hypothetical protein